MKSFINSQGIEIFKLDADGNLLITGNLSLGLNSTLYASNIKVRNFQDNIKIVRNSDEMLSLDNYDSYKVIYYIGNTEKGFTYGSWWEVILDDLHLNIVQNYPDELFVINASTFLIGEGAYNHVKTILDIYSDTKYIRLFPTQLQEDYYWVINYYNTDGELLYTDSVLNNSLEGSNYDFPFSPKNANEYQEPDVYIELIVSKNYELKKINNNNISNYMPLTGGTFLGTVNTNDMIPVTNGVYSIGKPGVAYQNGYFINLYADSIQTSSLNVNNTSLNNCIIADKKEFVGTGDSILITDYANGDAIKKAPLQFLLGSSKFLKQDGTFTIPETYAKTYTSFNDVPLISGFIFNYSGNEYLPKTLYKVDYDTESYQILVEGVTVNKVANFGIINKLDINEQNILIDTVKNNLPQILENKNLTIQCSYVDGSLIVRKIGDVPLSNPVVINNNITSILSSLSTSGILYDVTRDNTLDITITIGHYIYKPVNALEYDGSTTHMYLSKAGTWENIPSSNLTTPTIYSNFIIQDDGTIKINNIGNRRKPGVYLILDSTTSNPLGNLIVQKGTTEELIQTIEICTDTIFGYEQDARFVPNKITRIGFDLGDYIDWQDWEYEYPNNDYVWKIHPSYTWRNITLKELQYLLYTRPDAENKKGYIKVDGSLGYVILKDDLDQPFEEELAKLTPATETSNAFSYVRNIPRRLWDIYYFGALFLPCNDSPDVTTYYGGFYSLEEDSSFVLEIGNNQDNALIENIIYPNEEVSEHCLLVLAKNNGDFSVSESSTILFATGHLQTCLMITATPKHPVRFSLNPFNINKEYYYWTSYCGSEANTLDPEHFLFYNGVIYEAVYKKTSSILAEDY